MKEIKTKLKRC